MVLLPLLLLLPDVPQANVAKFSIEEVQARPDSFQGKRVRLCGEVTKDGATLFSDTAYPMHGRVGIKLRGYSGRGRGMCITGVLLRVDGKSPAEVESLLFTDAPVHPDYVLAAEPIKRLLRLAEPANSDFTGIGKVAEAAIYATSESQ